MWGILLAIELTGYVAYAFTSGWDGGRGKRDIAIALSILFSVAFLGYMAGSAA